MIVLEWPWFRMGFVGVWVWLSNRQTWLCYMYRLTCCVFSCCSSSRASVRKRNSALCWLPDSRRASNVCVPSSIASLDPRRTLANQRYPSANCLPRNKQLVSYVSPSTVKWNSRMLTLLVKTVRSYIAVNNLNSCSYFLELRRFYFPVILYVSRTVDMSVQCVRM